MPKIWKIAIIVLVVVVVVELIWAVLSLSKGPTTTAIKTVPQNNESPSIVLSSHQTAAKVGDTILVDVNLETAGHFVDGVDVIITFDPTVLSVETVQDKKPVVPGTLFKDYPFNTLDPTGRISFSAVASADKSFSGQGVLGSVTFKANRAAKTTIKLQFQPGSTTDSNISESKTAKDILGSVTNLVINIQ